MSKGFGINQKKVIKYYEEHKQDIPRNVIDTLSKHKPSSPKYKSDRSKIYRAIKRLRKRGVLKKGKTRRILEIADNVHPRHIPTPLRLNKENPDYKQYRKR